jgi:hypothetical protein
LPAGRMVVCGRAASNGKSERAVRWSQAEEADMFLQEEGRRVDKRPDTSDWCSCQRHDNPAQDGWNGWASSDGRGKVANGEPELSSCEYTMPVMDWMGSIQLIKARGVNYTAYTEAWRVPAEAFRR